MKPARTRLVASQPKFWMRAPEPCEIKMRGKRPGAKGALAKASVPLSNLLSPTRVFSPPGSAGYQTVTARLVPRAGEATAIMRTPTLSAARSGLAATTASMRENRSTTAFMGPLGTPGYRVGSLSRPRLLIWRPGSCLRSSRIAIWAIVRTTRLGFRRGFLLFVPLPFVVALLLTILFVMLLRRNDETLANRPFLALIALCAVQSVCVGLRWG